jgi:hypothetical protein
MKFKIIVRRKTVRDGVQAWRVLAQAVAATMEEAREIRDRYLEEHEYKCVIDIIPT